MTTSFPADNGAPITPSVTAPEPVADEAVTRAERHCETCICGRRAPVKGSYREPRRPSGSVEWWEHEEAWAAYAAQYGRRQSAERMAARAGFGYKEMTDLLGHEPTTWTARAVKGVTRDD